MFNVYLCTVFAALPVLTVINNIIIYLLFYYNDMIFEENLDKSYYLSKIFSFSTMLYPAFCTIMIFNEVIGHRLYFLYIMKN